MTRILPLHRDSQRRDPFANWVAEHECEYESEVPPDSARVIQRPKRTPRSLRPRTCVAPMLAVILIVVVAILCAMALVNVATQVSL